MVLSSKPLREYDICNAILLNNEGLSQDLAQLIAMETRDLYEYYGEEYASEIINKVINTKFYVASKQVSKNKPKMESVNEVLKISNLNNYDYIEDNKEKEEVLNVQKNRILLTQFFSNFILNIMLNDIQLALMLYIKDKIQNDINN